jgi:two-component system, cell cycle sensor histidine kinase and response regulator CckA
MEAVGQLAAGIAHDFNNFLTIVQGHLSLVLDHHQFEERAGRSLQQALHASDRAGHLTRQLLAFSLPQGGDLFITASEVIFDDSNLPRHPDATSGHFIRLTVQDTGCGMDAATGQRVFEPFFTTKEFGKGTGMGLATVHGIVKQHQGWIELESQPGRGTTFRIYLPVSVELPELKSVPSVPARSPDSSSGATILVVEDESLLLQFVKTVLESSGHRVLTAGNAAEALQVWREWSQEVTLLLTDIVMPGGTTGKDLADQLRAERPELRVIYTTGYSVDLLGDGSELDSSVALLQKPYPVSVLMQTVQSRLEAVSPESGIVNNRWRMTEVS